MFAQQAGAGMTESKVLPITDKHATRSSMLAEAMANSRAVYVTKC